MTGFNTKIGAGVLAFLAGTYMVLSLAMGKSARSEPPPDLSANAAEAGLDVWKTARAMLEPDAVVVDVRSAEDFSRYHVPGSVNAPGADAAKLKELGAGKQTVVIVAARDDAAQKLVGEARAGGEKGRFFYLQDGARSWYLAFDLPVPMFSDAPAPGGYEEALSVVRTAVQKPEAAAHERAVESLQVLAKLGYQPTLLKQGGKPRAAGPRKKIAGGCGG